MNMSHLGSKPLDTVLPPVIETPPGNTRCSCCEGRGRYKPGYNSLETYHCQICDGRGYTPEVVFVPPPPPVYDSSGYPVDVNDKSSLIIPAECPRTPFEIYWIWASRGPDSNIERPRPFKNYGRENNRKHPKAFSREMADQDDLAWHLILGWHKRELAKVRAELDQVKAERDKLLSLLDAPAPESPVPGAEPRVPATSEAAVPPAA